MLLSIEAIGSASDCVPVLRDLAVDDVHVVGEARAEGAVLNRDAGGSVLQLQSGLRDADAGGLAGGGLGGRRSDGLNMLRRRGGWLLGDFRRLDLFRDGDFVRAWRRLGSFFGGDWGRAWGFGGQDSGVERALGWRQRDETLPWWPGSLRHWKHFRPSCWPRWWKKNAEPTMAAAITPCSTESRRS